MARHPIDRPHYAHHHSAEELAARMEEKRREEADRLLYVMASRKLSLKDAADYTGMTYERCKLLLRWDRAGRPPIQAGGRPSV